MCILCNFALAVAFCHIHAATPGTKYMMLHSKSTSLILINNMIDTGDWKDRVFYYNADWYMSDPSKSKGFKFGCQDYWDFNNERFNPKSVDTM